jgi:hypothetical protein
VVRERLRFGSTTGIEGIVELTSVAGHERGILLAAAVRLHISGHVRRSGDDPT